MSTSRAERLALALPVLAALVGFSLIGWSLWQIYPPAAPLFAGLVLVLGAIRVTRERKEKHAPKDG